MSQGFIQLRRGLLEHCTQGRMPPMRFAMYIHLHFEADAASGIAWSSAKSLAARYGYNGRVARDGLEALEREGYIRRFPTPGRHGAYPILIHKYGVTRGARSGMVLNAARSNDYRHPVYENREQDVEQSVKHGVEHGVKEGVQHRSPIQEIYGEGEEERHTPPARLSAARVSVSRVIQDARDAYRMHHSGDDADFSVTEADSAAVNRLFTDRPQLTEQAFIANWFGCLIRAGVRSRHYALADFVARFDDYTLRPARAAA